MYHRLGALASDPWGLAVREDHFAAQLSWLRANRQVLPMPGFVELFDAGALPDDAVAITFDDGYADNLAIGRAALAEAGLSATLFVVSRAIGAAEPYWWDDLARRTLECTQAVDVAITVAGEKFQLAWASDEQPVRPEWRAWTPPATGREIGYLALWSKLQRVTTAERDDAMRRVRLALPAAPTCRDRTLTAAELRQACADDVFGAHGHSASHPALSALSGEERRAELSESLAFCRAQTGDRPIGFAYPYGDLDEATRLDVIGSGFAWACSTRAAAVQPGDDRWSLPRIAVGNWSADELARQLLEF